LASHGEALQSIVGSPDNSCSPESAPVFWKIFGKDTVAGPAVDD
jgi:hypothetical protein